MADSRYKQIRADLLVSYSEAGAVYRDQRAKPQWKLDERSGFLRRLLAENCRTLLEIGAGTGQDSLYFAEHGLGVVATDLSAAMVARCRAKGLAAVVMDFSRPCFEPASFDAAHAMNCLLHVPNAELPRVLATIRELLQPGGLFFLGLNGGAGTEGTFEDDNHLPPRFFSWRTDEQILAFASQFFDVVDFHAVQREDDQYRFQSLTLRRPAAQPSA